jgi:hypothetical protein
LSAVFIVIGCERIADEPRNGDYDPKALHLFKGIFLNGTGIIAACMHMPHNKVYFRGGNSLSIRSGRTGAAIVQRE